MSDEMKTLGGIVRYYRKLAGLKQEDLTRLSEQLAFEGRVTRILDQRRISRIESNAVVPHDDTLEAIAVVLAQALLDEGYGGSSPDVLLKHFRNVKEAGRAGMPKDLAALDAELAPYPKWYRDMIISLARTIHQMVSGSIESVLKQNRAKKADIPSVDASEE